MDFDPRLRSRKPVSQKIYASCQLSRTKGSCWPSKNVSRDDIHSLGLMGLYDALEKFDPTRELKFDTYASFRIRGAIIDGLRKEDWLSRSTREKAKKSKLLLESLNKNL